MTTATRIGTATSTYDDNGNLGGDGTRNYTWDYNNRPTAIGMSGATTTFKYDHGWNRVKKTKGATSTIYALGIYEQEGSGSSAIRRKYIPGGADVYGIIEGKTAGTSTTFIHNDHLSGASVLTNASGTKTELIDYYAFGEARLDEKTPYDSPRKYTGKELDEEINLYYYGARYYNPKTGRFISIDPTFLLIGMKGFEQNFGQPLEQYLSNQQALNSYSYVLNNPYRYVDPDGDSPAVAGLLIGTGVGIVQARGDIASAYRAARAGDFRTASEATSQARSIITSHSISGALGATVGGTAAQVFGRVMTPLMTTFTGDLASAMVGGGVSNATDYFFSIFLQEVQATRGMGRSTEYFSMDVLKLEIGLGVITGGIVKSAEELLPSAKLSRAKLASPVAQSVPITTSRVSAGQSFGSAGGGGALIQAVGRQTEQVALTALLRQLSAVLFGLSNALKSYQRR
jgi:RHS repeat-associated protein